MILMSKKSVNLQATVPLRVRKSFDASFDISSIRTKLKNFTNRKVENFLCIIISLRVENDVFISHFLMYVLLGVVQVCWSVFDETLQVAFNLIRGSLSIWWISEIEISAVERMCLLTLVFSDFRLANLSIG